MTKFVTTFNGKLKDFFEWASLLDNVTVGWSYAGASSQPSPHDENWRTAVHIDPVDLSTLSADGSIVGSAGPNGKVVVSCRTDNLVWGARADQIHRAIERHNRTKRQVTDRTQMRGKVFKRLKDIHPDWSQAKVAQEAIDELGEVVSGETVRNTYRLLGLTWERSKRIR